MPIFTKEALILMKNEELKEIYKKFNIKQGKNKEGLIANIVTRSTTLYKEFDRWESLKRTVNSRSLADPAPLHNHYRSWFNLIDLVDRKWYAVESHHQQYQWRSKMIQAILRYAVLNAWVYAAQINFHKWKDWRKTVALGCMHHTAE